MPRKKIESKEIEKQILEILEITRVSMSMKRITLELNNRHNLTISPQIVKRKLEKLEKEGKIYRIKNGN